MKRLVILLLLALILVPTAVRQPVQAQSEDCDATALNDWLLARQAWRNATSDVVNADLAPGDTLPYLYDHIEQIADLDRPDCRTADQYMLWTYYAYTAMAHILVCAAQLDISCANSAGDRIDTYNEEVTILAEQVGFVAEEHLDLRPEGWIAPTASEESEEESETAEPVDLEALTLTGDKDTVYDPVTIPAGVYRVTLITEGYFALSGEGLEGDCYDAIGLFNASTGEATSGLQAVFATDEGCTLVWAAHNVTAPYTVTWEQLN